MRSRKGRCREETQHRSVGSAAVALQGFQRGVRGSSNEASAGLPMAHSGLTTHVVHFLLRSSWGRVGSLGGLGRPQDSGCAQTLRMRLQAPTNTSAVVAALHPRAERRHNGALPRPRPCCPTLPKPSKYTSVSLLATPVQHCLPVFARLPSALKQLYKQN